MAIQRLSRLAHRAGAVVGQCTFDAGLDQEDTDRKAKRVCRPLAQWQNSDYIARNFRCPRILLMLLRTSLLLALVLGWVGAAQAQLPDSSHDGLNRLTGAASVVACSGTDKKDPP